MSITFSIYLLVQFYQWWLFYIKYIYKTFCSSCTCTNAFSSPGSFSIKLHLFLSLRNAPDVPLISSYCLFAPAGILNPDISLTVIEALRFFFWKSHWSSHSDFQRKESIAISNPQIMRPNKIHMSSFIFQVRKKNQFFSFIIEKKKKL